MSCSEQDQQQEKRHVALQQQEDLGLLSRVASATEAEPHSLSLTKYWGKKIRITSSKTRHLALNSALRLAPFKLLAEFFLCRINNLHTFNVSLLLCLRLDL